ncbi:hypothetical protein L1049_026518 [Liquidambar formosana]|uniref:DYW domain-containing protein n=1 Tax=Liquidambar formosana TaxID=63359 RepID=A0AAP0R903_LIQFO
MAILQSGLLPSNPLHDSSSSLNCSPYKLDVLPPKFKFKFRASTVRTHAFKNPKVSNQRYPQTRLTSIAGASTHFNISAESKTEIGECLSLLHSNRFSDCRQIHAQIVKLNALKSNSLIGNKLAILYSKNKGLLDDARKLFDEIPERTVPAYASLVGSYCRSEKWEDLFLVLGMMVDEGMVPDKYLVPTILKACSAMQLLRSGKMVHGYVVRKELGSDVFVGNALIDLYSNCGYLRYSRSVFDMMKERDVVSWTALVSAYMDGGLLDEATEIFRSMQFNGVKPDLISWNALVAGFARNGEIDLALQSLQQMQEKGLKPRVNSWNGIISGCVQNGYFEDGLDVFNNMLWFPEDPNVVTIVSILPACAGLKNLNLGRAVHGYALKRELSGYIYVEGSLIDMYSKCGRTDYAEKVFDEVENKNTAMWNEMIAAYVNEGKMDAALGLLNLMQNDGFKPDVITYNTILAGHARNGQKTEAFKLLSDMVQMDLKPNIVSFNVLISGFQQFGLSIEALKLFRTMQSPSCGGFPTEASVRPNSITTNGALAACADLCLWHQGKEIHGYVVRNGFEPNIFVSSALVDMYAKCNDMDSAIKVFWRVEKRNSVSWNVLLAGYINNKRPEEALKLFHAMVGEGLKPSSVTFMILLPVCGDMAALIVGRELHAYILKSQFDKSNNILASALIDMYAKCGSIVKAKLVFDSEVEKDVALWNAMISAFSVHGLARNAIALFEQMEKLGVVPDHITFIAVLSACTRDGLVEEGWKYFVSMENSYGITAGLEHHTCMVGILGGAGLLDEALDFIRRMPFAPDACLWATLLQACRIHSNPEIGERAAKALFELEPSNASNYILLSNIYTSSGMWDSAKNLRSYMRGRRLMTIKECSFINVGTKIHTFKGGKSSYLELEETLETWDKLASKMEHSGYFPLDPVFEDEEVLNPFSCMHTEKLAICFGIISSNAHHPIRISKNIRMCIDCHTSAKLITKFDDREIFVKDVSFYHHLKDGLCSCQDRW